MSPKVVVIASHHSDVAPQFAEWERHTKVRKTHMCSDGHTSWLEAAILISPRALALN